MIETLKQKSAMTILLIALFVGTSIGIILSFTILNTGSKASETNRLGNHFMLATGGTSRLSQWDQKIDGENWEEIQPLTLSEATNLRWEKDPTCVPNVGYYSKRSDTGALPEPYSLIFDKNDKVIGIYMFSEIEQRAPWQKMQARGPFRNPHWGLHIFFTSPSTSCQ